MANREADHIGSVNICHRSPVANDWSGKLRLQLADSLFINTSEGICITDAGERIVEVNPTLCRLTGFSKEELIGQTPRIFHSGMQEPGFYESMWTSLAQTGQWQGELWNRNRGGDPYAIRLNISVVCDEANQVSNYVGIMADITSAKLQQVELEKCAHHDVLTGLPNRILLADRLNQAIAQVSRTRLLLAVCYLDLDGFKAINDQYGHAAGDKVLGEVARRLSSTVRLGDTVARVGGDEFILLLWGLDQVAECKKMMGRIIAEVAKPVLPAHQPANLTVSVGIAICPLDGTNAAEVLACADSAMYPGGSQFAFFNPHYSANAD